MDQALAVLIALELVAVVPIVLVVEWDETITIKTDYFTNFSWADKSDEDLLALLPSANALSLSNDDDDTDDGGGTTWTRGGVDRVADFEFDDELPRGVEFRLRADRGDRDGCDAERLVDDGDDDDIDVDAAELGDFERGDDATLRGDFEECDAERGDRGERGDFERGDFERLFCSVEFDPDAAIDAAFSAFFNKMIFLSKLEIVLDPV